MSRWELESSGRNWKIAWMQGFGCGHDVTGTQSLSQLSRSVMLAAPLTPT